MDELSMTVWMACSYCCKCGSARKALQCLETVSNHRVLTVSLPQQYNTCIHGAIPLNNQTPPWNTISYVLGGKNAKIIVLDHGGV